MYRHTIVDTLDQPLKLAVFSHYLYWTDDRQGEFSICPPQASKFDHMIYLPICVMSSIGSLWGNTFSSG